MKTLPNKLLASATAAVALLGTAACDDALTDPQPLAPEVAEEANASVLADLVENIPTLSFRDGATLELKTGEVAKLVPASGMRAPIRVSYRTWKYPDALRVDILSEQGFDATQITAKTERFGTKDLWLKPEIQTIDNTYVRIISDVNGDGRKDLGLLFLQRKVDKALKGTKHKLKDFRIKGEHPALGAYEAVPEARRMELSPWSSSDRTVISIDPRGRIQATGAGKAVVTLENGAGVDRVNVEVSAKASAQVPGRPDGADGAYTPAGIDASGLTDVTVALREFFASVPDGSTIRLPAGAKYRTEGTILLENRRGLTIDGNGALIFAATDGGHLRPLEGLGQRWPRRRSHLAIHGGGDIVVRNLKIQGAHKNAGKKGKYVRALEGQHGIVLRGVDGVELDRVQVTDVYGDFVYLGSEAGEDGHEWAKNVHIHDSHFERNGRQGFGITGAENIVIENNFIGDVKRTAVDLEPNGMGGGAKNLTVRNNVFGIFGGHWFAGHGKVGKIDGITLEGNLVHDKMRVSTNETGPRRKNFRIVNNISDSPMGSPAPLMTLHLIDGIEVHGNRQPMHKRRKMTGVYVAKSCDVEISGNHFDGARHEFEVESYACK